MRYPVLIDGEAGAYGVVFPDLPGCVAMGRTLEEAMGHAEEALRDWVASMEAHDQVFAEPSALETITVPDGSALASVLLVRAPCNQGNVKVSLTLNADVADVIQSEAKRRKMTRGEYVEWMVRAVAKMGA